MCTSREIYSNVTLKFMQQLYNSYFIICKRTKIMYRVRIVNPQIPLFIQL